MLSESQASALIELNKMKCWQGETYLKEILLEKEWEYLGAIAKL